jgi:hypothetical protein
MLSFICTKANLFITKKYVYENRRIDLSGGQVLIFIKGY